jgi:hypothetical protein
MRTTVLLFIAAILMVSVSARAEARWSISTPVVTTTEVRYESRPQWVPVRDRWGNIMYDRWGNPIQECIWVQVPVYCEPSPGYYRVHQTFWFSIGNDGGGRHHGGHYHHHGR